MPCRSLSRKSKTWLSKLASDVTVKVASTIVLLILGIVFVAVSGIFSGDDEPSETERVTDAVYRGIDQIPWAGTTNPLNANRKFVEKEFASLDPRRLHPVDTLGGAAHPPSFIAREAALLTNNMILVYGRMGSVTSLALTKISTTKGRVNGEFRAELLDAPPAEPGVAFCVYARPRTYEVAPTLPARGERIEAEGVPIAVGQIHSNSGRLIPGVYMLCKGVRSHRGPDSSERERIRRNRERSD